MKNAPKIGAVFYILWGILHMVGGAALLLELLTEGAIGVLAVIDSAVPPDELPRISGSVASSVLGYHVWNILWFGLSPNFLKSCSLFRHNISHNRSRLRPAENLYKACLVKGRQKTCPGEDGGHIRGLGINRISFDNLGSLSFGIINGGLN